ncbi:glycosyltransferase [Rhizobium rhizogenes]|uniref:glycosyltransferase n=1 Tax=Rhizobium rhizogenes TaxID=359 RepID=UPI00080FB309|nr:glycosyltransferase [Rhizobium rhizogenes]NTI44586.1 glycosyltransferase [Rhizobium rhizogenes]OCJ10022.1 glycosyl transferase [Agrobacterium sp. B131/95]
MHQTLSIVVPTYNEIDNIIPFLERVKHALSNFDWELIFVDDNSSDGTASAAYKLSQQDHRVRVILRLADRGLARSSIQGMLSAKGHLLCIMDGDGQHDPAVVPQLVQRLQSGSLDVVSAARRLDEGVNPAALSALRRRISDCGNALSSIVIGRRMTDPLTGFFVIRRDSFLEIAPRLGDPGFKLLLDILHTKKSLRHAEVPFDFGVRVNGESKLDACVLWRFATFLMSKMTGSILPANLISFLCVGASGVLVHLSILYCALTLGLPFTAAQVAAALVAASSNFLLNNFLTFRDKRLRGWAQFYGYVKFLLISSVGILANVSAATITYERIVHVVLLATLAGIAIDTIWKFVVVKHLVWK